MSNEFQPLSMDICCYHCGSKNAIETDRKMSINYGNSLLFLSIDYRCDDCNKTFINNRYYHLTPTRPPDEKR